MARTLKTNRVQMLPPEVENSHEVRLLLVVEDGVLRDLCLTELAACNVEVVVVPQLFPVMEEVEKFYFNGLLFDIKSKMAEIRHHKSEVYRLTERLPTAHLQRDVLSGKIRVFHPGQEREKTLSDFIEKRCRWSQPQKIRNSPRKQIHIPVVVWSDGGEQRPRRLVTKDISTGGCFLVSYQRWSVGRRVRLVFHGIESLGSLLGEVRSVVGWGDGYRLPGVGVQFLGLSQGQEALLRQLCEDR